MKQTQGFVTEDGTFFESEWEAALYEAEFRLRAELGKAFPKLNQEAFFTIVLTMKSELLEYLNAHSTANATKPDPDTSEIGEQVEVSEAPEVDVSAGYVTGTEEDLAPVLKLPTRRPSHVPDMGSGTQSEEVPDRSKVDGAGSW
jgi:hypothetical protein